MALIYRRCVWQMTPDGYELLEADCYEYDGPIAEAKGGSAPVPDPNAQAAAEKSSNRYNIAGPTGSQTWSIGPKVVEGYDQSGNPIYGTQDTQTTTLTPTAQRQFDTSNAIAEEMLKGAQGKIGGPGGLAGSTFSYDQATPDVAKAAYQRQVDLLTPEFNKADTRFQQDMANAGIPLGSEAYNDAMRQHENDKNFALTQAAQQSEQEGSQLALSQRQQQYNELAAALGGQQVEPVNALSGANGSPINIAGAYQQANQARLANYNASQQQDASNEQAGASLASTAALAFMMY